MYNYKKKNKKNPNNGWKHFMTMQHCKDRILPLEKETCSRARQARQYAKQEQSCFLPPAQVQKQCRSSWHSRRCPLSATRTTTAFPGDHCPTHRWSLLVPVSLEQVPCRGKRLRLHIPPPLLNFSRNMLRRSPANVRTPISPANTPSLGQ